MSTLPFPPVWLRDNCPCAACRDPASGQKLFQITDLPVDLAVAEVEQDAETITVRFAPDGHVSSFSRRFLFLPDGPGTSDGRSEADKQLWAAADLASFENGTTWARYRDDEEQLRVLRRVASLGFAILRGAPTAAGTLFEIVATFGYLRETNYGELFEVRVELSPSNLAFTGLGISPHTDNPYRDPVPTLQLLHCLSNAAEGGETGLVDGFMAAAVLREEQPEAFQVLTSTLVPFAWSDARASLRAERPLIETDPLGRIRGVRFNNRSMQTLRLEPGLLDTFYDSYRAFAEVIARPELQLRFRLEAGDCLIFDNTRLLHSRTAFRESGGGTRHLQGCYADLDGLMSTIEVLTGTR